MFCRVLGSLRGPSIYAEELKDRKKQRVWISGAKEGIPFAQKDFRSGACVDFFESRRWKKITFGVKFGVSVSENREIFIWGWDGEKFIEPKIVKGDFKIPADIQCSEDAVFVLDDKGKVWFMPIPEFYKNTKSCFQPLVFPTQSYSFFWNRQPKIRKISMGRSHAVFLTETGEVLTAGSNSHGQLGRPLGFRKFDEFGMEISETGRTEPVEPNEWQTSLLHVSGIPAISEIQCGGRHTIVLSPDGKVLSFGDDSKIQLGLGDTRFTQEDYNPWLTGLVYKGGIPDNDNRKKVIPLNTPHRYNFYERHVTFKPSGIAPVSLPGGVGLEGATAIACGEDFTVLQFPDPNWHPEKGNPAVLIACGENGQGQCGRNKSTHQQESLPVRLPKGVGIQSARCGTGHCLALLEGGQVWGWGANRRGQLGSGNVADLCPPALLWGSRLRGPINDQGNIMTQEEQARWKVVSIEASYDNSVIIAESVD